MAYEAEGYAEVVDGVVVEVDRGVELGDLRENRGVRELASAVKTWMDTIGAGKSNRKGSLLTRDTFTPPENTYAEMAAARVAVDVDDVVSGVYEITESFAFQGVKAQTTDEHKADVFNQINADLDLDSVIRRMWKGDYTLNQFVQVVEWGEKTYRPRLAAEAPADEPAPHLDPQTGQPMTDPATGRPMKPKPRRRTRKEYRLKVPTKIALIDDLCVAPMKDGPLGEEVLLWSAVDADIAAWDAKTTTQDLTAGTETDDLFLGSFAPTQLQVAKLNEMGFRDPRRMLILNPKRAQRYTGTKPDWEDFAPVRLKSCFALLDLKRQLMNQDRVNLVGAANFILLIKKGDKDQNATKDELENLKENYQVLAKLPVIISDHRLTIEIIAPKIDLVLDAGKYDLLDSRLLSRLLNTLSIGGKGQRNETNVTMSYAVARAMENRRHMLKRHVERTIYKQIMDRNKGAFEDGEPPTLAFTPANISLGFDSALSQMMSSLFNSEDVSRETMLEFVGLDQGTEALRKEIEDRIYDGVFGHVLLPGAVDPNNPNPQDVQSPQSQGATGGRPPGGGTTTPNPRKPKAVSENGNPKRSQQ